jgi:hypothetical protein
VPMLFRQVISIAAVTTALMSACSSPMLAQGLGEYGAVGGGAVGGDGGAFSSLASALAAIEDTVRNAEPRTWIIASVSAVLFWFLLLRTR